MRCAGIAAALLLIQPTLAAQDEKPKVEHHWKGFGVGSWIVERRIHKFGEIDQSEAKKTIRVEDKNRESIRLQEICEGETPGVFDGEKALIMQALGYNPELDPEVKVIATDTKELTIQGKNYVCEVKTYDLSRGEAQATATYWYCKDLRLPLRKHDFMIRTLAAGPKVVKLETDYKRKDESEKVTIAVVSLDEERQVGKVKVKCIREDGEAIIKDGKRSATVKVQVWSSEEVPGRLVETTAEGTEESSNLKGIKQVVIEAFEVVKDEQ